MTEAQRLTNGTFVGDYRIARLIGAGGMGEVYEAFADSSMRRAALKVLSKDRIHDSETASRLRTEGRALQCLKHKGIVELYEMFEFERRPVLAMEYIDGVSLDVFVTQTQRKIETVIDLFRQVLFALKATHAAGVTHCDLKPENILVESDGNAKIIDFGTARLDSDSEFCRDGDAVVGTVHYLAPEIIAGKHVTAAADIYSAGLVLYFLLSHEKPFDDTSNLAIIRRISMDQLILRAEVAKTTSSNLKTILNRMTARDPKDRYACIDDVLSDLAKVER